MPHTLKITPLPSGPGVEFLLDGHDVASQLSGYTIRHRAGLPPAVEVELTPHAFEAQLADATVELAPELADVLVRLGWTPPSPESVREECFNCEGAGTACSWCGGTAQAAGATA